MVMYAIHSVIIQYALPRTTSDLSMFFTIFFISVFVQAAAIGAIPAFVTEYFLNSSDEAHKNSQGA